MVVKFGEESVSVLLLVTELALFCVAKLGPDSTTLQFWARFSPFWADSRNRAIPMAHWPILPQVGPHSADFERCRPSSGRFGPSFGVNAVLNHNMLMGFRGPRCRCSLGVVLLVFSYRGTQMSSGQTLLVCVIALLARDCAAAAIAIRGSTLARRCRQYGSAR